MSESAERDDLGCPERTTETGKRILAPISVQPQSIQVGKVSKSSGRNTHQNVSLFRCLGVQVSKFKLTLIPIVSHLVTVPILKSRYCLAESLKRDTE